MPDSPHQSRLAAVDFSLFILVPLLALGLGLLTMAGWQITQHIQSLSWQPVSAQLLELGGERAYVGDGLVPIGAGSRATGRYAYVWQGRPYESTRLCFSPAYSRQRGSTDDWEERLGAHLGSPGNTLSVWVDPRQPSRAVAFRDVRWLEVGAEVGFGLLLSLFGLGGLKTGRVNADPAAFSWQGVAVTWVVGGLLGVLVPLLWRDGHPIWAAVSALPLLLAINGTIFGLRRQSR